MLKILALPILCVALLSCAPTPYHIDERLPFTLLQSVKSRYAGKPLIVTLDDPSRTLQAIKAEHDPLRNVFGERIGYSFPIGATFAAYLQQAQKAGEFDVTEGRAVPLTATIENVDLYYSFNRARASQSYIDWVSLTLKLTTTQGDKVLQRVTLNRELSLKDVTVTYAFDRALRITLGQLVLDYLDGIVKRMEEGRE